MEQAIHTSWTTAEISSKPAKPDIAVNPVAGSARFASLLRLSGAFTMIAAMASFLLQDWAKSGDITHYYLLLGQTALLSAIGFGINGWMKEPKGARVFLGLSLLSITTNMVTLAALIFSVAHWGRLPVHAPGFAMWHAESDAVAMLALAAGITAMAPVAYFGFLVLCRRSATRIAGLFVATNLLLLIPVRESGWVGLIVAAGLLAVLAALRPLKADPTLRTREGAFALATLFVPLGIIVARSLLLYSADAGLQLMLYGCAYGLLAAIAPWLGDRHPALRRILGGLSMAVALMITMNIGAFVSLPPAIASLLFGLIYLAFGYDVSRRFHQPRCFDAAAIVLAGAALTASFVTSSLLGSLLLLGAGGILIVLALALHRRFPAHLGIALIVAGAFDGLHGILGQIDLTSWASLTILGVSALVIASVVERYGSSLMAQARQTRRRLLDMPRSE